MLGLDRPVTGENNRSLDDVLELAKVPWPGISLEEVQGVSRDPLHLLVDLRFRFAKEVIGQDRQVLHPFAKPRKGDRERIEPIEEVPRNSVRCIAVSRSRFVAAMTRTRTRRVATSPTGLISPAWSTRRSLPCISSGISPISSRKIVPPSAFSNRPTLSAMAPVNAPRRWPNNSDSISEGVSAVQLTVRSGLSRRGEYLWMARATNSFPVPDSLRTNTVVGAGATRATSSAISRILRFWPLMKSPSWACSSRTTSE